MANRSVAKTLQQLFGLNGKTALITGGGRGLGRGIAQALAQAGANIIVTSRSESQLKETLQALRGTPGQHAAFPIDLTAEQAIPRLMQFVTESYGPPQILVHAAGNQVRKPALELTPQAWQSIQDLHLKSGFFLAQAVADSLIEHGKGGAVVFIASLASRLGLRNASAYGAAKSGLVGLVRALGVEWSPYHIRVNAIAPGYFRTALTEDLLKDAEKRAWVESRIPLGRLGTPEDLAGAAIYLSSDASSYVTGQVLFVDGGWTAG